MRAFTALINVIALMIFYAGAVLQGIELDPSFDWNITTMTVSNSAVCGYVLTEKYLLGECSDIVEGYTHLAHPYRSAAVFAGWRVLFTADIGCDPEKGWYLFVDGPTDGAMNQDINCVVCHPNPH